MFIDICFIFCFDVLVIGWIRLLVAGWPKLDFLWPWSSMWVPCLLCVLSIAHDHHAFIDGRVVCSVLLFYLSDFSVWCHCYELDISLRLKPWGLSSSCVVLVHLFETGAAYLLKLKPFGLCRPITICNLSHENNFWRTLFCFISCLSVILFVNHKVNLVVTEIATTISFQHMYIGLTEKIVLEINF